MKRLSLLISICFILSACSPAPEPEVAPAPAPAPPPPVAAAEPAETPPPAEAPQVRLRGTVANFDVEMQILTMSTLDGEVMVRLAPNTGINGVVRRSLADVGDNTFIGTTAVTGADGRWHATEVHIFPEAMRGAGEGHYPWDLPESTMTNAAVTGTTTAGDGRTLKLKYATGELEVDVAPDTPIVELVPGDLTLLSPGATVFVLGVEDSNGTVNAFAILAEKDGVKPPM